MAPAAVGQRPAVQGPLGGLCLARHRLHSSYSRIIQSFLADPGLLPVPGEQTIEFLLGDVRSGLIDRPGSESDAMIVPRLIRRSDARAVRNIPFGPPAYARSRSAERK